MIKFVQVVGLTTIAVVAAPRPSLAADASDVPALHAAAVRRSGTITVDGLLDDSAWASATVSRGFTQRFPLEGVPPTHDTEFRVVYDDAAIYIGIHAVDDDPDHIRGLLTRRDQPSQSDWLFVGLDSYHDRRTAFVFGINPAGVQRDFIVYDDARTDDSWDAVWTCATHVDRDGWTAEFRIPLSQLRFSAQDHQRWGLQFQRFIGRTGEESVWSPWPRSSPRIVSEFGTLDGIDGVKASRRLELLPYASGGSVMNESVDHSDPFARRVDPRGNLGLDVRYGLSSAMTLAATINPDFGQVEADPSQVNLSANELFFPEKRPFFLEGADIFSFTIGQGDGNQAAESLFYSRRIGAAPHGDPSADYVKRPDSTTIYGATKVSGKTASGWSVGVLDAVTSQERADTETTMDDGTVMRGHPVVEPLTNYAVARLHKDLREGRTTIGAALTAVDRKLDDADLAATMHDHAYAGGLQLQHQFHDDEWNAGARLLGSWVHGTTDAIADTQQLQRHLFQRPDAGYLDFDPRRRSLSGMAFLWDVGKQNGGHWHYGALADTRSPGFEVNDLGFQPSADYYAQILWAQYRDDRPGDTFLTWAANFAGWGFLDYSPRPIDWGGNVNLNGQLLNQWNLGAGVNVEQQLWDNGALRGGASLRDDPTWNTWANVSTDGRKKVQLNLNGSVFRKPAPDTWRGGLDLGATIQARPNLDLFVGPSIGVNNDDAQYVEQVEDVNHDLHYVFARIHQVTAAMTLRANWTFTPRLSLQVYAQPFIASGDYSEYKEAADTHAHAYRDRFRTLGAGEVAIDRANETVTVDRGDGLTYGFDLPDFDVREARSNVVLRWEYLPGSTLFFIWAQGRSGSEADGRFRLGHDLADLLKQPGDHVVMVKLNYWVGL